jgi:hypothetical protein
MKWKESFEIPHYKIVTNQTKFQHEINVLTPIMTLLYD